MLTRTAAPGWVLEAHRLTQSPKFGNSRTLRRFFGNLRRFFGNAFERGQALQVFVCNEGHSAGELEAIRVFAEGLACWQQDEAEMLGFAFAGTQVDEARGLVQNVFSLPFEVQTASLAQLQALVHLALLLASGLESFERSPLRAAAAKDYQYRNLPCSVQTEDGLWLVSGYDKYTTLSGVLEWCSSQRDGEYSRN